MSEDEWRVEVDLDDEQHGFGLSERLRAHDLDDEARARLGRRVIVTRDGSRLFRRRLEEAERREAAEEGSYDWRVKIELPSRSEAAELAAKLSAEGLPVHRRWRYVTVDVLTEELANELGARLREALPADAEIWVEANPDDIPNPTFVLLESRL